MYRFTGFFVLLASCVLLAPAAHAEDSAMLTIETPKPLPVLHYSDERRGVHTLNETQVKLTAVHFWATWCAPCVGELPQVDAAAKAYGDKGLRILALSLDGDHADKVRAFFASHGITALKPLFDPSMEAFEASGGVGLPTTIFIDAKGNEIARAEGPLNWESKEVKQFIEKQLK